MLIKLNGLNLILKQFVVGNLRVGLRFSKQIVVFAKEKKVDWETVFAKRNKGNCKCANGKIPTQFPKTNSSLCSNSVKFAIFLYMRQDGRLMMNFLSIFAQILGIIPLNTYNSI